LETILYPDKADPEDLEALGQDPEDASLARYGLAFDYVPMATFSDQQEGYFRYQISWGGPSDEIRFYLSIADRMALLQGKRSSIEPESIVYWFMDWFDGASKDVTYDEIARATWQWFADVGGPRTAMQEADVGEGELLAEADEEE